MTKRILTVQGKPLDEERKNKSFMDLYPMMTPEEKKAWNDDLEETLAEQKRQAEEAQRREREAWDKIHKYTQEKIAAIKAAGVCERCAKYKLDPPGKPTVTLNYSCFFVVCEKCSAEMNYYADEHWKEKQLELEEEKREVERHRKSMEFYEEHGYWYY